MSEVAHDIRWWYFIVSWYCLASVCIVNMDDYHCPRWNVCLTLWRRIFVPEKYVIGGGWSLWVILCTQEGTVLKVIPNPLLLFIIGWREEAHCLKSLGAVAIIALHVGLVYFHMYHGRTFFQLICWDGCLKPSVAGLGRFILPFL